MQVILAADGQNIERPGRGFQGIAVDLSRPPAGHHDGLHAQALGRAGNGPEVAHVGNAVEQQQEGHFAFLKQAGHDGVERGVVDGRHEGYRALVIFAGEAVELLAGH